ncbi:MAG TPA: dihydrolipoamide acetyltransferase family protein [Ktedonobacteraceae bacterium]|nr:dihydrolipoamide acetyltransferase family protein [Ktedonobacteraceae bacterium]
MQEFKLPDLGEGMQEAEIRRWLIQPGDTLKLDQPMVEVETDKAVVEIPSPIAGRVSAIRVQEGAVAKLGEVLVIFDTPGATSSPARPTATTPAVASPTAAPESTSRAPTNGVTAQQRVLAAPAVRKRAFELGIELANVQSSHPSGRVTMDDLQHYVEHAQQAPAVPPSTSASSDMVSETAPAQANGARRSAPVLSSKQQEEAEERQPLTGLRKRIAERMERSWRTIPHATAFDEIDGTALTTLRQTLKPLAEQRGVRLTYMPLLVKLLLPVLKEFPIFNASLDEEKREIVYRRVYHIGIATDSPEGLLVPVLRDADQLTIMQIAGQLEYLIAGAQKRSLALPEVSGSTFTLNNVGSFGGSSGTPIINYPETAILAVGRLQEKAIVQDGKIVARTMLPLALSFDHRVIDGALAGRFLARFRALAEQPQQLLLDML